MFFFAADFTIQGWIYGVLICNRPYSDPVLARGLDQAFFPGRSDPGYSRPGASRLFRLGGSQGTDLASPYA